MVDWQTVCKPKEVGGLGLTDPLDVNKARGAKIRWKLINHEEEPWAKLWHEKYELQWPKKSLIRFGEDPPCSSIQKLAQ